MISLQEVCKSYGNLKAVDHLSLEVAKGEICVLLGKSGCGKSTTLKMINRLIPSTSGQIKVNGKNVEDYVAEKLRRSIGYVVQSIGLFPYMTVEHNISLVPQMLKWDKKKTRGRVEELLELVGLDVDQYIHKYPGELSGGEAQRVGVARALAADPPVILMDEPFGAVDPINRTRLQKEFLRIQKQLHKTVVFVTHDIEEALKIGDKIGIMDKGVLQSFATPEKIMLGGNKAFVREFLGEDYFLKILSRFSIADYFVPFTAPVKDYKLCLPAVSNLQNALAMMVSHGERKTAVQSENGTMLGEINLDNVLRALKKSE